MRKSLAVFLLPVVALGAAVPLESKATLRGTIPNVSKLIENLAISDGDPRLMPPSRDAYKVEHVSARTTVPGAKRIRIKYGPYRLRAANSTEQVGNRQSMDRGGTGYLDAVTDDFPKDVMVLQVISEVQTPGGSRVNMHQGLYNHHNMFMELVKPVQVFGCDPGPDTSPDIPITIFAAGATEEGNIDYFAEDGAIKAGYYLPKDRKVFNLIDVINYNNFDMEVYTTTEIEYLEGRPAGYALASQQRVDPGICGGLKGYAIHAPKDKKVFNVESKNIVALRDGWILNARGHLHDGGLNVQFKVNDKEVCNSVASYGGEGHESKPTDAKAWKELRQTSYCNHTIAIKKGDRIYMQANYDLNQHPSREQGGTPKMGGMARRNMLDDDAAEQMALMVTHFAVA